MLSIKPHYMQCMFSASDKSSVSVISPTNLGLATHSAPHWDDESLLL